MYLKCIFVIKQIKFLNLFRIKIILRIKYYRNSILPTLYSNYFKIKKEKSGR